MLWGFSFEVTPISFNRHLRDEPTLTAMNCAGLVKVTFRLLQSAELLGYGRLIMYGGRQFGGFLRLPNPKPSPG